MVSPGGTLIKRIVSGLLSPGARIELIESRARRAEMLSRTPPLPGPAQPLAVPELCPGAVQVVLGMHFEGELEMWREGAVCGHDALAARDERTLGWIRRLRVCLPALQRNPPPPTRRPYGRKLRRVARRG